MYCTQTDLEADIGPVRLIELTDISATPAGVVDVTVMERAVLAATGEIDSYTGARYGVPLPVITDLVRDICCALTLDRLFRFSKPDEVKDRAAAARKLLAAISMGNAALPGMSAAAPVGVGEALFVDPNPSVFSRDTLADYNA